MSVDFSQFEDGDTVRVTFEGKWVGSAAGSPHLKFPDGRVMVQGFLLQNAKSAELVEREVKPYNAGDIVLCGPYVRMRHADGEWRDSNGNGHASDRYAREAIRSGIYTPVVLHGKLVAEVPRG